MTRVNSGITCASFARGFVPSLRNISLSLPSGIFAETLLTCPLSEKPPSNTDPVRGWAHPPSLDQGLYQQPPG